MSILKELCYVMDNGFVTLCEMSGEKMRKIKECTENATLTYKKMTDEQLDKEVNRMKKHTGGDSFEKVARMKTLKEELDQRRK